jgi:hypothetical protein
MSAHGRNCGRDVLALSFTGHDPTWTWEGEGVVFNQLAEVGGQTEKHHAAQSSPYR